MPRKEMEAIVNGAIDPMRAGGEIIAAIFFACVSAPGCRVRPCGETSL